MDNVGAVQIPNSERAPGYDGKRKSHQLQDFTSKQSRCNKVRFQKMGEKLAHGEYMKGGTSDGKYIVSSKQVRYIAITV